MVDRRFWEVKKSHAWLDDTCIYLLESKSDLYAVVLERSDDTIQALYSSFDWASALKEYNIHKSGLMKNHTEWYLDKLY